MNATELHYPPCNGNCNEGRACPNFEADEPVFDSAAGGVAFAALAFSALIVLVGLAVGLMGLVRWLA